MTGAIRARIPTFAVMVTTAGLIVVLALTFLSPPESGIEKLSVRSQHETQRALQEAIASAQTAASTRLGDVPQPPSVTTGQNFRTITQRDQGHLAVVPAESKIELTKAPIPELSEPYGEAKTLPKIAEDGRAPWQVYSRPSGPVSGKPKAIIVVAGLGTGKTITNEVVERLPGAVTLVVDAQADELSDILQQARRAGHETLLALPAEPFDYPQSDPGPDTLLTNLSANENIRRLRRFMSLGSGYIGLTTLTGSRYLSVPKSAQILLQESRQRGLALFDVRLSGRGALLDQAEKDKQPAAGADFVVQPDMTLEEIDEILAQTEATALKRGTAVCLIYASPLAIDRLHRWLPTLPELGILLMPFSAVLK